MAEEQTFEVKHTGRITLTAWIHRDLRPERVQVDFSPRFDDAAQTSGIHVDKIIAAATEKAIEMVAKFMGMDKDDLEVLPSIGVGALSVVPKTGKKFPA